MATGDGSSQEESRTNNELLRSAPVLALAFFLWINPVKTGFTVLLEQCSALKISKIKFQVLP